MASVNAHIARHFWRNGKTAIWQSSDGFPSGLLSWLKANYSELVSGKRPCWLVRPEGTVYLFFNDEREMHGRMATRLTVCWIQDHVVDRQDVYKKLQQSGDLPYSELLVCPIKTRTIKNNVRGSKVSMLVGVMVVFAAGAYLWSISLTQDQEQPMVVSSVHPISKLQHGTKLKRTQHHPSKSYEPVHNTQKSKTPSRLDLCHQFKSNDYCFQYYVVEKCDHQTKLNYSQWLHEEKNKSPSMFSNRSCPEKFRRIHDDSDIQKYVTSHQKSNEWINALGYFLKMKGEIQ